MLSANIQLITEHAVMVQYTSEINLATKPRAGQIMY